jgi:hypothetical protein
MHHSKGVKFRARRRALRITPFGVMRRTGDALWDRATRRGPVRARDAASMTADIPQETSNIPADLAATFVQNARSMECADDRLSLRGISTATLYFSEGPPNVVGHITARQFVDLWTQGEHSFFHNPPIAVLAFVGDSDRLPTNVVLVLRRPRLYLNTLAYECEAIDGSLPASAGACSLFIEPPGRPLTPRAVMELHRARGRGGRRARGL